MIRCMLVHPDKSCRYGNEELIAVWRDDPNYLLWIDIDSHEKEAERTLLKQLDCHPLAIIDAQRERHPPKIELFDNYIFMLYRGIYTRDQ